MDELRRRARDLRKNATDAERHLWQRLRARRLGGYRFRRQVPVGGYIADFLCPELKLIVELDGGQHGDQVAYDSIRTRALEGIGFQVLRYWNDDVLLRTETVLDDVLRNINSTPPQPSPSLREREGAGA
jgi:very-short-patch-repair endonuclease